LYKNNGAFSFQDITVSSKTENYKGVSSGVTMLDINNDRNIDIMGVGTIYDAEVETIRYDSNFGYVLLENGKGEFNYAKQYDRSLY